MGTRYIVKRRAVTPVAGEDLLTVVAPANRRIELVEFGVGGRHTASSPQILECGSSTGGTTGGGAITPTKEDPDSEAADSTVNTTWAAQPTMDTNPLGANFNSLGGAYRWVRPQGAKGPSARNSANLSLRCPAGAPTPQPCDVHLVYEEV